MTNLWGTAKAAVLLASTKGADLLADQKRSDWHAGRRMLAVLLAALLATGPLSSAFAQSPAQNPPSNPAPAAPPASEGSPIAPVSSLGLAAHDFSNGPRVYPNLLKAYQPIQVENPVITNSLRLDQLIRDGKLELSLQDAVEVKTAWTLKWSATLRGWRTLPSSKRKRRRGAVDSRRFARFLDGQPPFLSFDPNLTSTVLLSDQTTPVNNPLTSGTGVEVTTVSHLEVHTSEFNTQFTQGLPSGANLSVSWDNTRSSSTSRANFFNPGVLSSLTIAFNQPLLSGFGLSVNRRNILIAKNNRKVADWAFAQQAIATITNTIIA